jgi:nifR3 family TIM-barrel protein
VVAAVVRRAQSPVSVKIRAGWDEKSIVVVDAARIIESEGAQWMSLHARTKSQGFGGTARWEWIAAAKQAVRIPVIGNGDITTAAAALQMFEETACDSVMIGRGSFGYPWIFAQVRALMDGRAPHEPTPDERVEMALRNLRMELEESTDPPVRTVRAMRKHLAWYVADLPGSKELRTRIFGADTYAEVEAILRQYEELGAAAGEGRAASFAGLSCDSAGFESATAGEGVHA